MFDDPVDIGRIDGPRAHFQRSGIDARYRNGNVIRFVEVADDARGENFVDLVIKLDERLDTVEQFESCDAVVGRNTIAGRVLRAGGDAAVRLASDLEKVVVMFGFGTKHGIAPLDLVERFVKCRLLPLTESTVGRRNLLLVANLDLIDGGKQVGRLCSARRIRIRLHGKKRIRIVRYVNPAARNSRCTRE